MPDRKHAEAAAVLPQTDRNRYYAKVSKRYLTVGILLLIALLVYVVCMMTFFGEYVTYENLKYLLRDWDTLTMPGDSFTPIVYNADSDTEFTGFRDGLAIVDGEAYRYYDVSGAARITSELGYTDPAMASSDKYMLVYEVGGKGYSVYNALTCIVSREADGKILAGDVADNGALLLVTRSRETRFVVELYNAAFNKVMSIYKENYVLDAAISPDGEYAVIVSAVPTDTDFNTEVALCRRGKEDSMTVTLGNAMPLAVSAWEDGYLVLCNNAITFFDYTGETVGRLPLTGMTLRYADVGSGTVSIVGSLNALGSENRVITASLTGEILDDRVVRERVTGVYASPDMDEAIAYLKGTDAVFCLNPDGTVGRWSADGDLLAAVPLKDCVLLCQKTGAVRRTPEQLESAD